METQAKKGMTSTAIKVVAIVTMFIDHVAAVFLERQLADNSKLLVKSQNYFQTIYTIDSIMRLIGRIAFPLFIFLMVQGFVYTKSRLKYALRLGLFVLISEIPFDMAFNDSFFDMSYQSVFFTLLLGFLFMCLADFIYQKNIPPILGYIALVVNSIGLGYLLMTLLNELIASFSYSTFEGVSFYAGIALIAAIVAGVQLLICRKKPFVELSRLALSIIALAPFMFVASLLKTDYGAGGVLAIAAAYAFRNRKVLCLAMAIIVLTFMNPIEIFSAFGFIPVALYNGQKGKGMKYFFYAFYPCHLLIIAVITHFILG